MEVYQIGIIELYPFPLRVILDLSSFLSATNLVLSCVHSRVIVAGVSAFHSTGTLHHFLIALVLVDDDSPVVKKPGREKSEHVFCPGAVTRASGIFLYLLGICLGYNIHLFLSF